MNASGAPGGIRISWTKSCVLRPHSAIFRARRTSLWFRVARYSVRRLLEETRTLKPVTTRGLIEDYPRSSRKKIYPLSTLRFNCYTVLLRGRCNVSPDIKDYPRSSRRRFFLVSLVVQTITYSDIQYQFSLRVLRSRCNVGLDIKDYPRSSRRRFFLVSLVVQTITYSDIQYQFSLRVLRGPIFVFCLFPSSTLGALK